jgi:NADH-quinone oxidoreductase subunit N
MLSLAGIPGTIGFIGKFQLIRALIDGSYTWLAIILVVGSMISLGYYLRVIAAVWMRPETVSPGPGFAQRVASLGPGGLAPLAGGSSEADGELSGGPSAGAGVGAVDVGERRGAAWSVPDPQIVFVAVVFAAATIVFGIFPSPVFHLADHAASALTTLL